MVNADSLVELFGDFGFEITSEIVAKCLDLCITHNINDEKEFVESYVAFSVSHLNGAEPSIESLSEFERKELIQQKKKPKESNGSRRMDQDTTNFNHFDAREFEDGDELMEAYISKTPKAKRTASVTVLQPSNNDEELNDEINSIHIDGSCKAIYTFGKATLIKSIDWTIVNRQNVKISQVVDGNNKTMAHDEHFMFDTLCRKSWVATDRLFDIGQEICLKLVHDQPNEYGDLFENLEEVDVPKQTTMKCIGRICSDSDCSLSLTSTMLIGADEMRLRTVNLNFNRLKSFALFPGETIFVQGLNPRGDTLFVDKVFAEKELKYSNMPTLNENLSIVTAAGPFTYPDDLNYEMINNIIAYCKQHSPNVIVLIGPFLDIDHKLLAEASLKTTYETFFENLIIKIMDTIGSYIEVLVVSSNKDIHSTSIYPTQPYNIRATYKNLTFLPDPCTVKINGVTVGISSTDILTHILDAELAINAGEKIKRVVNHLFNQSSFYPLNPPSEKMIIDFGLAQNYAILDIVPNILIIPSALKPFIREINRCLIMNPGSTIDNRSRGTFGRIMITPSTDNQNLSNIMASQIVKY